LKILKPLRRNRMQWIYRIHLKEGETIKILILLRRKQNAADPQNSSEGGTESVWD